MLSDCEKCCNTPCGCGWDYRNLCYKYRIKLACAILGITPKIFMKKLIIASAAFFVGVFIFVLATLPVIIYHFLPDRFFFTTLGLFLCLGGTFAYYFVIAIVAYWKEDDDEEEMKK